MIPFGILMITFKQYLSEAPIVKWKTSSKADDAMLDQLKRTGADWEEALANGTLLIRGFKNLKDKKVLVINSTNAVRVSEDTNNVYQLMMDASSALKNYPSRSNSFICTTSILQASAYGRIYVVVPYANTPIARSIYSDIFGTVIDGSPIHDIRLTTLSRLIGNFLQAFNIEPEKNRSYLGPISKYDEQIAKNDAETITLALHLALSGVVFSDADLKHSLRDLSDDDKKQSDYIWLSKLVKDNPKNILTALSNHLMTPDKMSLGLFKFGEQIPERGPGVECWFSGKCLAIELNHFATTLKPLIDDGTITAHNKYDNIFKQKEAHSLDGPF